MIREQIEKNTATARASSDAFYPLSDNERNALHYSVGSICRHLRKEEAMNKRRNWRCV